MAVWLYRTQVAVLAEPRESRLELTWTEDAYQRWGYGSRVVSHLLAIGRVGTSPPAPRVKVFIDGLLPEGIARTNYAIEAGIDEDDTYGLIGRYGRDTAGALVFQHVDEPRPDRVGTCTRLTGRQAGRLLLDAHRHSPGDPGHQFQSISLAGMEPKIGVHRHARCWLGCHDGAPSTWILKLAAPDDSPTADVVDTEALCADLARRIGLASHDAHVTTLGDVRAIAVQRFDRVIRNDGTIDRIHQEDLAQALGLNTADPERKYQRGRRLPSLAAAARVLRDNGSQPDQLLRLATFSHLLGNTDFHAKNIAFIHHPDGTASLAPAYDIAARLHHRTRNPLAALDINGKSWMREMAPADLVAEGQSWGLPDARATQIVIDTVTALRAALDQVDLDTHTGVNEEAFGTIRSRVMAAGNHIPRAANAAPPAKPSHPKRTGPRRRT